MKAELLFHEKIREEDGSVVEMKIWQLSKTTQYPLGVKYSLYWVKDNKILLGYDNHWPKGPHKHFEEVEQAYSWVSLEQLVEDFQNERKRIKHEGQNHKN